MPPRALAHQVQKQTDTHGFARVVTVWLKTQSVHFGLTAYEDEHVYIHHVHTD